MKDYTGLNTLLSAFRLIRQAIKNSILSAGDGIDITETAEGPKIGVTTPVQGIVTQAEFDALPEEQQNKGFYVISDSGGGSGGGVTMEDVNEAIDQQLKRRTESSFQKLMMGGIF